jgi:hypothetical protein
VRRLVLLLTCVVVVAPGAEASAKLTPALRTMSRQPLVVQGVHFRAAERVTVRVAIAGAVRVHVVRANVAGTFTTTFTAVTLERCSPFVITASGSRGSVATIRPRPFLDCNPL